MINSKILIIYTGGTIGMIKERKNNNALINKTGPISEIMKDLKTETDIDIIFSDTIYDSSKLNHSLFNSLLNIIKNNYYSYQGFLIVGGTDTMSYLQSLLKWQITGLDKPIILTGAIRSFDEDKLEGLNNIRSSIRFIKTNLNKGFVGISMNGILMTEPTTKVDSTSINPYYERKNSELEKLRKKVNLQVMNVNFYEMKEMMFEVIYVNPLNFHIFPKSLADGLIILTYGQGTINDDMEIFDRIKQYKNNELPIIVISQCLENDLNLEQYTASELLSDISSINGAGSGIEEALACLSYFKNNMLPRINN